MTLPSTVPPPTTAPDRLTYIDLFAGCGGLSLGLHASGWEGMFAVERSPMAFETFKHNLVEKQPTHFPHWPKWFPKEPCSIQTLTRKYSKQLRDLRGQVMLIAGGPPCQGFSSAGRRQKDDHRNQLYQAYIKVVELVRPALVLLENVTGITLEFGKKKKRGRPQVPYSERIRRRLERLEYRVFVEPEVLASAFGVPQDRVRFVAVAIDVRQFKRCPLITPFQVLSHIREEMLLDKGLSADAPVSSSDALSDLLYQKSHVAPSPDTPRHEAGKYHAALTPFQRLMRADTADGTIADSHRFVKHSQRIIERFEMMLRECPRGKGVSDEYRVAHGIKKACIIPMDADRPSPTLTTIPDDLIHYSQPRVLTVRESARLQSFPDWFQFKSKYTTGGQRRKVECPRYTQVANAVPPLLAEALGRSIVWWMALIRPDKFTSTLADVCKKPDYKNESRVAETPGGGIDSSREATA